MWQFNNELYHHGILGMKWGVRRYQNKDGSLTPAGRKKLGYKSVGIRARLAKRENDKVDKSFKQWKNNANKKQNAIDLGKKANLSRLEYEKDKKNKELKKTYKTDTKSYKKALRSNTSYHKGAIRGEVGKDLSRKYLSEAKKIQKKLNLDPNNKELKRQYDKYNSLHDIERARARKAPSVGASRSSTKAGLKRGFKIALGTAVASTTFAVGANVTNHYLKKYNVKINGKNIRANSDTLKKVYNTMEKGKDLLKFIY